MHQIRPRLGLRPDPAVGDYSAPYLAGFKGPTSKGREVGKEGGKHKALYVSPFFILVTFTFLSVFGRFY